MDSFRAFNRATSLFLAGQGALLLLSPSMVAWMLSTTPQTVTALETLLARTLSLALLALSALLLLFSGELAAIYADGSSGPSNPLTNSLDAPHATPTLYLATLYHVISFLLLYTYGYSEALSGAWLTTGSVVHAGLAAFGGFLVLFGKDPGHRSRRTGADKRTSGFPFTNAEAAKRKL